MIILLPWVFAIDGFEPPNTSGCPEYIENHESKRQVGKISALRPIVEEGPQQFDGFIYHIDLDYGWITVR